MSEETRRRWRRRLLLAGLLPLLLAVGFAAKVTVMLIAVDQGRGSYEDADYTAARRSFAVNSHLNVLETWVAPYDEGTTRYRLDDLGGAVRLLTEALVTVPRDQECRVRVNLALAHESLGDVAVADGRREEARASWRTGAEVLAEGGCLALAPGAPGSPEGSVEADEQDEQDEQDRRDRQDRQDREDRQDRQDAAGARSGAQLRDARVVDERLRDKLRVDDATTPPDDETDPEQQTSESAAELAARLEERNRRAEEQRRRDAQRQEDRAAEQEREEREPDPGTGEDGERGEPRVYEW